MQDLQLPSCTSVESDESSRQISAVSFDKVGGEEDLGYAW